MIVAYFAYTPWYASKHQHIHTTHRMMPLYGAKAYPCHWSVWMVPGTFDQNGEPVALR